MRDRVVFLCRWHTQYHGEIAMENHRRATLNVSIKLVFVVVGMFGFGYLMVPLYNILCEVTGLNGKTGVISTVEAGELVVDEDRWVNVEFTGTVNVSGPWEFRPAQASLKVQPGKQYNISYVARNLADHQVIGQAVPSVAPRQASKYFNKTECFCFTKQVFEANEEKDMPVTFVVDPALPKSVDSVVLSYTFFDTGDKYN